MAVIDLDLGRYDAARDRLHGARGAPAGPDEHALHYRLLATVYVELGDAAQALKHAEAAAQAIPAEDSTGERPYAQQAEARALALAGRYEEALAEIDAVIARFLADGRYAPIRSECMRAQRYRAQILAKAGRDAEALHVACAICGIATAAPRFRPSSAGLLLDALGEAELRAGNGEKSQLAHEAAAVQLLEATADGPSLCHHATRRCSPAPNKQPEGEKMKTSISFAACVIFAAGAATAAWPAACTRKNRSPCLNSRSAPWC